MTATETTKLNELSAKLGVEFKNLDLLREALTHRSYINENRELNIQHNERLEFLGDAVLELASTRFLFEKYPDRPEGELTSFRAALVRTESLAVESKSVNLGEYIFMSKGEEATGGRNRPYILANTVEATIGAIYMDQGFEATEAVIKKLILWKADEIVNNRLDIDAKSKFQEQAQERVKYTPQYELTSEVGPDHDKVFKMTVKVNNFVFGEGEGHSKQEAEQQAASNALKDWDSLYQKYQDSAKISTN